MNQGRDCPTFPIEDPCFWTLWNGAVSGWLLNLSLVRLLKKAVFFVISISGHPHCLNSVSFQVWKSEIFEWKQRNSEAPILSPTTQDSHKQSLHYVFLLCIITKHCNHSSAHVHLFFPLQSLHHALHGLPALYQHWGLHICHLQQQHLMQQCPILMLWKIVSEQKMHIWSTAHFIHSG